MTKGFSLRYHCEKCGGPRWMAIEGSPSDTPYTLKCKECKTRYENADPAQSSQKAEA